MTFDIPYGRPVVLFVFSIIQHITIKALHLGLLNTNNIICRMLHLLSRRVPLCKAIIYFSVEIHLTGRKDRYDIICV